MKIMMMMMMKMMMMIMTMINMVMMVTTRLSVGLVMNAASIVRLLQLYRLCCRPTDQRTDASSKRVKSGGSEKLVMMKMKPKKKMKHAHGEKKEEAHLRGE